MPLETKTDNAGDPFAGFKAVQRDAWALFAPLEVVTMVPAAKLVKFARIGAGQRHLDVACGTGVVPVTAARRGAVVSGLDLSPVLLERARQNAEIAGVAIDFTEGDVEALPYADASFDVVTSQFGHIFAPRPMIAIGEMLRVLKPGGTIAFNTWPPELFVGQQIDVLMRFAPPPPPGAPQPPSPMDWGKPDVVRERLGDAVTDLRFDRDVAMVPSLSPQHTRRIQEETLGLLRNILAANEGKPEKLAEVRATYEALIAENFEDNQLRQSFLMTRATKRG
jgi:SAM-dependent methyltransferase